jgi:malonyl-CoA decarboxylase
MRGGAAGSLDGTGDDERALVARRAALLRLRDGDPERDGLPELTRLVARRFHPDRLEVIRITHDSAPSTLERIVSCEQVHAVTSADDLRNRLDDDRRCYVLVHRNSVDDPIVVVQIALARGFVDRIATILDVTAPVADVATADTAVFYSINACEPGLAGINLGATLLERAIERLADELPHVVVHATLSPVPELRAWVLDRLRADALERAERALAPGGPAELAARLADDRWVADDAFAASVRPLLLALTARYLTTRDGARVVDPVANFHLSNGASIDRVCWMADPGPVGLERSLGIMASYRYEPAQLAARARAYAASGEVVVAPAVLALAGR